MNQPLITLYGAHWCSDCRRSKQFLGDYQIPYTWVDIEEDKAGEQYVIEKNDGKRIIPTIVFGDGSFLVEPTNAQIAMKLGLKMTAARSHYDLIIVGGGPAGLTAGLYAAREGIDTLIIERAAFGGQAATTQWLDNMPGFAEGISGAQLSDQLRRQAERFGVEMLQAQNIKGMHSHDNYHCVDAADGAEYSAEAVLIATGSRYRRLGVEGEDGFIGAGIHFCATCDGPFYKGKPVAVVGGGNSAAEESLLLVNYVQHVTLLVRGDHLKASQIIQDQVLHHPQIDVRFNTAVERFSGARGKLSSVIIRERGTPAPIEIQPAGVFIFVGQTPNTACLDRSRITMDPWGFIVTGHDLVHAATRPAGYESRDPLFLETSVPGIFAAGDVRAGSTKQVASAAGEGATAALLIRQYMKM